MNGDASKKARSSCSAAALAALLAMGAAATFAPLTAHADVTTGTTGFVVKHEVTVPLAPTAAYAQVLRVQDWWDPEHTYSGKAENLSVDVKPGGCWCESLEGGGFIEHMRLILAWPAKAVRFDGALGPLQQMGVSGALTFAFKPEGEGTRVTLTYAVGGHAAGGFESVAKPVESVLGAALARYAAKAGTKP